MIKAKKSLSQNYLIDKNIIKKIINKVSIENKTIIEIGPGYGALTDFIIKNNPKKIILIEKDYEIFNFLSEKYKNKKNIILINDDFLNVDINKVPKSIVISNLPYNVGTKIILKLLKSNNKVSEIICMIQKEVALKFDYKRSKINKYKFYSKITSDYEIFFNVSPNSFYPKPKVHSSVVKFRLNKNKIDWYKLETFTSLIFKNLRKKIGNNISINDESINYLLNKRLNEITIRDLIKIYNFF